jgi:hypothetical protein
VTRWFGRLHFPELLLAASIGLAAQTLLLGLEPLYRQWFLKAFAGGREVGLLFGWLAAAAVTALAGSAVAIIVGGAFARLLPREATLSLGQRVRQAGLAAAASGSVAYLLSLIVISAMLPQAMEIRHPLVQLPPLLIGFVRGGLWGGLCGVFGGWLGRRRGGVAPAEPAAVPQPPAASRRPHQPTARVPIGMWAVGGMLMMICILSVALATLFNLFAPTGEVLPSLPGAGPNARFTGPYEIVPVDDDDDQVFEELQVHLRLAVRVAGKYAINGQFFVGEQFIAVSAEHVDAAEGDTSLVLRFSGDAFRLSRLDGPYELRSLVLMDMEFMDAPVDRAANVVSSPPWRWQQLGTCYGVSAVAEPPQGGQVLIGGVPDCGAGKYGFGTPVTVRATPSAGYEFAFWTGDVYFPDRNPEPVLIIEAGREFGGDRTIGALFVEKPLP